MKTFLFACLFFMFFLNSVLAGSPEPPPVRVTFSKYDTNKDGKLSPQERKAMIQALRQPSQPSPEVAATLSNSAPRKVEGAKDRRNERIQSALKPSAKQR